MSESTVREAIAAAAVEPQSMQKWGLIEGVLHRDELDARTWVRARSSTGRTMPPSIRSR